MKNIESAATGKYVVEILKSNGGKIFPFGDRPINNLILDTFYSSILQGYQFGLHSFVQSCKVGTSSIAASRTQTDLSGTIVGQTSASGTFVSAIDSASNSISMTREFIFPAVPVGVQISYSEAVVGNFAIANTSPITTSRFVFPGVLILESNDILKITYTLTLSLAYLNSNVPISLSGGSLNFDGYIRMSTNNTGILPNATGNNTVITLGNSNTFVFRDYTQNSTSTTADGANPSTHGAFQNIFGTAIWVNKIGFFDTSHIPTNYPNARSSYTALGPLGTISLSNLQATDTFSSIDATYTYPAHTASRTVGGVYLWYFDNPNSNCAIYYKFNNAQTIPQDVPITLKIKWIFNRN